MTTCYDSYYHAPLPLPHPNPHCQALMGEGDLYYGHMHKCNEIHGRNKDGSASKRRLNEEHPSMNSDNVAYCRANRNEKANTFSEMDTAIAKELIVKRPRSG